jgi:hypothetical protein
MPALRCRPAGDDVVFVTSDKSCLYIREYSWFNFGVSNVDRYQVLT